MRYNRSRPAVTALALVAAALVLTTAPVPGRSAAGASNGQGAADELVFPRPGGGPRAIHGLISDFHSYLLDTTTGEYRPQPYDVYLSPDRRMVAVDAGDRIGVANRWAYLRTGERAVRWTDLPPWRPAWSPDGRALLVNTIDKGDGPPSAFAAHRYDLDTGRVRSAPIEGFDCGNCSVGWAADSRRYVVTLNSPEPGAVAGPMQYVNPDGSPGPMVGAAGRVGGADAYSPDRRYVIVEPARPNPLGPPVIFDLHNSTVVATIATGHALVGWYDERRVVRISPGSQVTVLEVVDIHTGAVSRRVPASLPPYGIQLGSSCGLHGDAVELGF